MTDLRKIIIATISKPRSIPAMTLIQACEEARVDGSRDSC